MKVLRPGLAAALGFTAAALFFVGLIFRFAVYSRLYIGPNDPYGISDVIELILGVLLLLVLAVSVVAAFALAMQGSPENRKASKWLALTCAVLILLLQPLHHLAARFSL
ncbi:hypothetical protein I7X39_17950 [Inhella sp. 1Y17]|uniref:Uncharacterized protein n=1 Tax=Inhella proteolytica TaxID=2795029 RepID=A0A931NIE9_9BURK|nr:hypothetical protein [Inhella proteolytica]